MCFRTTQDYTRYLEQMLMLSNHRLKRQALIAEGLDGPKKYPPESIKLTKRARGLQLLYCENPRISLLLSISQLLQAVTPERREKIRDIYEASLPRYIVISFLSKSFFIYPDFCSIAELIQKTQCSRSVIGINK